MSKMNWKYDYRIPAFCRPIPSNSIHYTRVWIETRYTRSFVAYSITYVNATLTLGIFRAFPRSYRMSYTDRNCPTCSYEHVISVTGTKMTWLAVKRLNQSQKSKSKSHYDRQSVGQFVLVSGTHLGPATKFAFSLKFSLDNCGFIIL
jgi:hypothetical protein